LKNKNNRGTIMLKILGFIIIISAITFTFGCSEITTIFEEKKAEQEQVEDMGIWAEDKPVDTETK